MLLSEHLMFGVLAFEVVQCVAQFGSSDSGQMKVSSGDNPIFLLALSSQKFPQLAKSLFLIHLVTTVQRTLQLGIGPRFPSVSD
jgi:hypothetical protein